MTPTLESITRQDMPTTVGGFALIRAAADLWRVARTDGRVVGHLRREGGPAGPRYSALRLSPRSHRFTALGSFWSVGEAVDCLRWSR